MRIFKNLRNTLLITMALTVVIGLKSCKKDSNTGKVELKMTDAPADDANVKGVFVTVADVKLDGKSLKGFQKTTFDLSAYQNGDTKSIFSDDMEMGSYSEITLVLDYEKDADGDKPGTYVLLENGTKESVSSKSMAEFTSKLNFELSEDEESAIVVDFDLRKSIQRKNENSADYTIIEDSRSETAMRAVEESNTGTVSGNTEDKSTGGMDGYVVAFLYAKGDYTESSETSGDIMFSGAVSSAMVQENGAFKLAFVEEGDYEIHFANFMDEDGNGTSEFQGMVQINGELVLDGLVNVSVSAQTQTSISLDLLGLF